MALTQTVTITFLKYSFINISSIFPRYVKVLKIAIPSKTVGGKKNFNYYHLHHDKQDEL